MFWHPLVSIVVVRLGVPAIGLLIVEQVLPLVLSSFSAEPKRKLSSVALSYGKPGLDTGSGGEKGPTGVACVCNRLTSKVRWRIPGASARGSTHDSAPLGSARPIAVGLMMGLRLVRAEQVPAESNLRIHDSEGKRSLLPRRTRSAGDAG